MLPSPLRSLFCRLACALIVAGSPPSIARAGELYFTGFENFTVGDDTIAGTDGWTGSSAHAGLKLSGVDSESDHLVPGIGNAAFIGGRAVVLAPATSRTVNVRRAFNVDPFALGQEIARLNVVFGIKDSTFNGFMTRRDNFEFAFYNNIGQLIGFIQFDNSTLDPITQAPAQTIRRSSHNGTSLIKVDTGTEFYYDVLMALSIRINFRTNRWSAMLNDLDIFADQPFYTGSNVRTLGTIAAQMQITGTGINPGTLMSGPAPGDNYMLFDNFTLRIDPVPVPYFRSFDFGPAGEARFSWQSEALYKYQVEYTDDFLVWRDDLPGSAVTATLTGPSPVFTDASAAGRSRRFYRVWQMPP